MAIITTSNLSQSFGSIDVFRNISVSVPNDGKIGLVGPNGIGKTSLLLVLAGHAEPTTGETYRARDKKIGYLLQESAQAFAGVTHSVSDEMMTVFDQLRSDEIRLREIEEEMSNGQTSPELLESYGSLLERFENAGGYDFEVRVRQVLQGLGFDKVARNLEMGKLSGGQKTRALLAKLLLEKPDLLILDEPTNHLDVEAIEWLEGLLKGWEGAIIVVSHDRYFLDAVINTVWEMGNSIMETYSGNYTAYVHQRQERWERREIEFKTFKERMAKELDFIRRNIASQNTAMAKGKLKRVGREIKAVELHGVEALNSTKWSQLGVASVDWDVATATQHFRELKTPSSRPPRLGLDLKAGRRSGRIILRATDLTIGYPGKTLFTTEELELHRLECAALLGPNGTGKTTFLRTLRGEIEPLQGEIKLGASLEMGYFAQAHEQLNQDNTVIDELMRHHPMLISEARSYLGRYLFRGDDAYKLVSSLSGGERGRLAMALLAMEGANFLLLDEPTNHLDITAQELLQEVLEHYQGTILLVTHDRYLVSRLATQIWQLEDGHLRVFKGNFQRFVAERERLLEETKDQEVQSSDAKRRQPRRVTTSKNEAARHAARLVQLEVEIVEQESKLKNLAVQLQEASQAQAFDNIRSISIEYSAVQSHLEELMLEWENLAGEQTLAQ
ncbi:MAG TPA: ABC-F family ATP-binding cassette domain-containing protein [candidate division Zixibacteria bacterium]|nr:ABC-F family ATP-binding cassette domain-containing protein [candidate division Zixibacteria bacterium]